jgi:hypothetical protein
MHKPLPPGLFPVTLYFADDEDEFAAAFKKNGCAAFEDDQVKFNNFPTDGTAFTVCTDGDRGLQLLVALGEQVDEDMATSIIIHEAVHCWQFTKKAIHEKHPGIETEAYSVQYFATWMIRERLKRQIMRAKAGKLEDDKVAEILAKALLQ